MFALTSLLLLFFVRKKKILSLALLKKKIKHELFLILVL